MKERKLWTKEEDEALMFFKEKEKINKWCDIAKLMKQKFGKNARNEKQCRDRYVNHLRMKKPKTQWNKEDEEKIIELHKKLGNKWVAIAEHFDGITEIFIKNQFYSRLRKSIRKLNKYISEFLKKEFKEFKLTLVFKLASVADGKLKKLNEIHTGLSEAYSNSVSKFLIEAEIEEALVYNLIRPLVSFEKIFNLLNKYRKMRPKSSLEEKFSTNESFKDQNVEQKNIQLELDSKIKKLSENALKELEELLQFEEKYLEKIEEVKNHTKEKKLSLTQIKEEKMDYKSSVSSFKENEYSEEKIVSGKEILEGDEENLNSECMYEEDSTSVVEEESLILEVLYEENSRSIMFIDDPWMNESEYDFVDWEN